MANASKKSTGESTGNDIWLLKNEIDFLTDSNFDCFGSRSVRMDPATAPDQNSTVWIIRKYRTSIDITMYRFEKKIKLIIRNIKKIKMIDF